MNNKKILPAVINPLLNIIFKNPPKDTVDTYLQIFAQVTDILETLLKGEVEIRKIEELARIYREKINNEFTMEMANLQVKYILYKQFVDNVERLIRNAEMKGDKETVYHLLEKWKEFLLKMDLTSITDDK